MKRSLVSVTVCVLLFAGCRDDLSPILPNWQQQLKDWQDKIASLKEDDEARAHQLSVIRHTPTLDPVGLAAKDGVALAELAKADRVALTELDDTLARNLVAVQRAFDQSKLEPVTAAIATAKSEVGPRLTKITEAAQDRRDRIAALNEQVTRELEVARVESLAVAARNQRWEIASIERMPFDLTNLRFRGDTAELEKATPAQEQELERLVTWANSCAGLSFTVTGHVSREFEPKAASELSEKRAEAVKRYLVGHGVEAAKVVRIFGAGAMQRVADEPAPDSEEAKAMPPADLEALRTLNRRVTIEAVKTCPAG